MQTARAITTIIEMVVTGAFSLLFLYQFFYTFYVLFVKEKEIPFVSQKQHKFGVIVSARNVERISEDKPLRMKKEWVPIEEISPNIVNAVIASEDNKFMEHWGFDFDAIKLAAEKNKKRNSTAFGASTISQQTAKNLFLWPDRSWFRKGLEVYFTLLIELFWSKERIMEVYLNIIEMGDGIYGIERAANIYYDISASELNREQAAIIAASLPSPRKYNPKNPTAYLKKRQSQILKVMRQMGK